MLQARSMRHFCPSPLLVTLQGVTVFSTILLILTQKAGAWKIFCVWAWFQAQVCVYCFIEHFLTLPPPTSPSLGHLSFLLYPQSAAAYAAGPHLFLLN